MSLARQPGTSLFFFGCALELALGLVAIAARSLTRQPMFPRLAWTPGAVGDGLLATAPLFLVLFWTVNSRSPWVRTVSEFIQETVRPTMMGWNLVQLFTLSLLAGAGEELFFRGFVQAAATRNSGTAAGILIAAVVFGLLHWVNQAYAFIAAGIGAYLGLVWIWTDNLVVPATAHAFYDFVALIYFLRLRHKANEGQNKVAAGGD